MSQRLTDYLGPQVTVLPTIWGHRLPSYRLFAATGYRLTDFLRPQVRWLFLEIFECMYLMQH